jgi:DNA repair exonuclease SbcCD ATPase subunit
LSFLCNNSYILEFDEELNEKIKTRGEEIQYISLSGGEKRKINLAVLMGLKDLFILNDSYDSDFVFFDEIAENLDKEGIDGLFNLLQEIKKSKDIFVITHNKYLKANLDSANRISIIKESGSSTVQE